MIEAHKHTRNMMGCTNGKMHYLQMTLMSTDFSLCGKVLAYHVSCTNDPDIVTCQLCLSAIERIRQHINYQNGQRSFNALIR